MDSLIRILVTGSKGFIGKNLIVRLRELRKYNITEFTRGDSIGILPDLVRNSDVVVHLAGENRPTNEADFGLVNTELTVTICNLIKESSRKIPIILASSIQAELDNAYGRSKLGAEKAVMNYVQETDNPAIIYRLPGVFGKWCRPNYNSVVATFCHNIANDIPIEIQNKESMVKLVYVDDVVSEFIDVFHERESGIQFKEVAPCYSIKVGELAEKIQSFKELRKTLQTERVGTGILKALYSTYISYLPPKQFIYDIPRYCDERGIFVEILKTRDSGQFSFFSALPGATRGEHYHHTKTEKFLVIKGSAKFRFRNILTDETVEILASGENIQIVDTIPGWAHNITNIGEEEMFVLLWSNELFDAEKPDTISCKV